MRPRLNEKYMGQKSVGQKSGLKRGYKEGGVEKEGPRRPLNVEEGNF